jgi:GrpB-like predicted nucleotidyltransferase (UPF0157 family)
LTDEPPLDDDQLRRVLVHGPQPRLVELAEYDPRWPEHYERHRHAITGALTARVRLIEHIGSTSVPGLAAKPIIDVVVGVDGPDDGDAYLPDLVAAGYELRVVEPGHRCLRGGPEDALPANVHCCAPDSDEVLRYRLLRDRMRSHPADRERYEATKRSLAGRVWPDTNYYAEAKGPTIWSILRDAGWTPPIR